MEMIRRCRALPAACGAAFFWFLAMTPLARGADVVLHLKNGDRLAGTVVSENATNLVLTTIWAKELVVPVSAIERREDSTTNAMPAASAAARAAGVAATPPPAPPKKPKHWKLDASVGADYLHGQNNQELYHGRLTLSYERPYDSYPTKFFRNVLDYAIDYGWTQTPNANGGTTSVLSADRSQVSDKTGFDLLAEKWYVYDLAALGYDKILKINFQDEIGPGVGYHLITRTNLQLNAEIGVDYQEQYRSDETRTKDLFFRAAEDSTWKISPGVTFTEKFEFLPRANSTDFRARAESSLNYALWRNVSLRLSMLDLYDTQPAEGVANNDLQVHTSIGVTF